jgi:hypothetical protein
MWPWVGLATTAVVLLFLGRLKLLYYFSAFGVGLGSLDLTFRDQLFESWFIAQNLLFTLLLWWVALKTRALWVTCVAVTHALLPIATHYAFVFHEAPVAAFLIDYRHTLLKLVPFAVLLFVYIFQPRHREALSSLRSPLPRAGNVLLAIVLLSWAVSAAKHFGSYDANLVLRDPATHLSRLRLVLTDRASSLEPPPDTYLLHANHQTLVLWDPAGFDYGHSRDVRTLIVPREAVEWIEATRSFDVQPGKRFL